MKKIIKYIFTTGTAMLLFVSCSDWLEETPIDFSNPDNYFTNEEEIVFARDGMYAFLMSYYMWKLPSWNAIIAENTDIFASGNWFAGGYAGLQAGLWYLNDGNNPWEGNYYTIARTNVVIKYAPGASGPKEVLDQAIGEAYFLRGFCYFDLVRRYGPAVLRVEPVEIDPSKNMWGHANRRPIQEIYRQIEKDLKMAISYLKPDNIEENTQKGRPNQLSAMSMLATVYMHMAGAEMGETQYYQEAYNYAKQVKEISESTGYPKLDTGYMNIFQVGTQNKNPEILFSIQTTNLEDFGGEYNYFTPPTSDPVSGGGGSGRLSIREDFISTFEPGDKRIKLGYAMFDKYHGVGRVYEDTVYYHILSSDLPAEAPDSILDETSRPDGVTMNRTGTMKYYYHDALNRRITKFVFVQYYTKKYIDPEGTNKQNNRNQPIMKRYADVLLVLAEAANEIDETGDAYEAINLVRDRAGIPLLIEGSLNKDEFRQAVWLERRHELYAEFNEFFDLKRQGIYLQAMAAAGRPRSEYQMLLPLPIGEINANDSINVNNPGY